MESSGRKWVTNMFIGEFAHNFDDKSRIIIPVRFREELADEFIVTRGLDGCLFVYPRGEWQLLSDKLKTLPLMKKEARDFVRFFMSGATPCTLDKQGRVVIPQNLKKYAHLEKECAIIGVSNRLEIWDKETWENQQSDISDESLNEITESLIGFDFFM